MRTYRAANTSLLCTEATQISSRRRDTASARASSIRPRGRQVSLISVDYFQIELTGFIGSPSVDTVLFECAERGSPAVCDAIRRFPDGRPALVAATGRNLGRLETRGVDAAVDVNVGTRFGDLNVGLVATYLEEWDEQPFPKGEVFHLAGQIRFVGNFPRTLPRWRAWGHVDWSRGAWRASYAAQYVGGFSEQVVDFPEVGIVFEPYMRKVESAVFHDLEGGYEFGSGPSLRAAITNVTDEDPPFVDNESSARYRRRNPTRSWDALFR